MYPHAEAQPGMLMLRVDAPWYFGALCALRTLCTRRGTCLLRVTPSAGATSLSLEPCVCVASPAPLFLALLPAANSEAITDFIRERVATSKRRRAETGDHIRWAGGRQRAPGAAQLAAGAVQWAAGAVQWAAGAAQWAAGAHLGGSRSAASGPPCAAQRGRSAAASRALPRRL